MRSIRRAVPILSALALLPSGMSVAPAWAEETLSVVGTLTGGGVECPTMQGDDGTLYSLTPSTAVGLVSPGVRVRVEGTVAEVSFCQEGTTISVIKIEPVE